MSNSKRVRSRISSRDQYYLWCFSVCLCLQVVQYFNKKLENSSAKIKKSYFTEGRQSLGQKDKKSKKRKEKTLQIQREDGTEAVTRQLNQNKPHRDPLNLVFNYFDSRLQEIQNEINKNKEPVAKIMQN